MEAVEFYIINGSTCYRKDGVGRKLTPQDRECIEFMMDNIQKVFPDAMVALRKWASASVANKYYFEYRIVDRFIRCNFGEADFMYTDVDDLGMFHLEEVKCPLRSICEYEGVVCKPKPSMGLPKEELRAVGLYVKGLAPSEIADQLGKSENTIKHQLASVCKRLKLPGPRWLMRVFGMYNITM